MGMTDWGVKIHRYGSRAERENNRIPTCIEVTMRLSGEAARTFLLDSKYRIRFTDEAIEFIDTAGAGVTQRVVRGLVREFNAGDAEALSIARANAMNSLKQAEYTGL